MDVKDLLRAACKTKASDLHLRSGSPPRIRVDGQLVPLTQFPRITPADMEALSASVMNERQRRRFEELHEIDMAYGIPELGRFRLNVFRQRHTIAMALRVLPETVPRLAELHLPAVVERICEERRGLVLVTGTTGSGKSTTLAAMIDRINSTRPDHIVTIEDPIEFHHPDKRGFVNQREVDVDTTSFSAALRSALRQDPNVILVGEMRDLETIQTALIASETGHMVFSTLHTLDATETIQRIIAVFPVGQQEAVRKQLAITLKAVISQRLVRRADGVGRVPAAEVLISTEYIRDCITNPDKTRLIRDAIAAGTSQYGMQTFDQSLYCLYTEGLISLDEALLQCSNPDDFRLRISGIHAAADAAREQMERQTVKVDRFGEN